MSQTGRPPEAAPALLYEDPETGIKYLDDEPFDNDGSNSNFKEGVALATVEALPACTYANGTAGDGATLTADSNGRLNIDGVDAVDGQRVLIANEVATATNGIYTVTEQGSAGTAFVLTRAVDFNASTDIKNGAAVVCNAGDDNAGLTFRVTSNSNPVIGTNPIAFAAGGRAPSGTVPVKADGAEVDAGTDDAKFITPKALEDSDYIKEADLPPSGAAFVCTYIDWDGFPSLAYDNGVADDGVGATLTAADNDPLIADGSAMAVGETVLVANFGTFQNGIYELSSENPCVLTRIPDFDTSAEMKKGRTVYIRSGTQQGSLYVLMQDVATVGSDSVFFNTVKDPTNVKEIIPGSGISVDNTNPANPVVAFTGETQITAGTIYKAGTNGEPVASSITDDGSNTAIGGEVASLNATQNRVGSSTRAFFSDENAATMGDYQGDGNGTKIVVDDLNNAIKLFNVPSSDPSVANQIYQTAGVLMISAG